jgi:hypothetical protein
VARNLLLVASPVSHEIVEGLAVLLLIGWSLVARASERSPAAAPAPAAA